MTGDTSINKLYIWDTDWVYPYTLYISKKIISSNYLSYPNTHTTQKTRNYNKREKGGPVSTNKKEKTFMWVVVLTHTFYYHLRTQALTN